VEFPGYGVSSDYETTEQNIYTDTQALLDRILDDETHTNEQIILHGRSLGAGVAMEMSTRGYGNRLVLLTPFTSTVDIGALTHPRWLAEFLIEDRFDNLAKASNHPIPTLIIGALGDTVTPFWMAEELNKNLPNSQLHVLTTGDHGAVYQKYAEEDWQQVFDFISKADNLKSQ
jgi:pimeloyl-ACP methyl ester carboxylesterase